jgi:hypothetical protein
MDADGWFNEAVATARALLDSEEPQAWQVTTLTGTGGGTFGDSVVSRFDSPRGTAIVKIVKRNGVDADHPLSWRRELDIYNSVWLRSRLPTGLQLPDCLGSATTDEAAVIVLADVPFDDPLARDVAWYGDLATLLARMSTCVADDSTVPSWVSRGFLEHEIRLVESAIPDVVEQRSPAVDEVIDVWRPFLERIEPVGAQLVDALHSLPVGLNHLDAFSRNAARVGDHFVMIDWAYTGLAPVGCDAASLIAITAMALQDPAGDLESLREAVTTGYASGLASGGVRVPVEQLDFAIDIALTLRFVGFLTQIHRGGDNIAAMVEAISGRPFSGARSTWTALAHYLTSAAQRALTSVGA